MPFRTPIVPIFPLATSPEPPSTFRVCSRRSAPSLGGWFTVGLKDNYYWGFPKIRCTTLGVPIIRTRVFWGLYWGPPILGNYLWACRGEGSFGLEMLEVIWTSHEMTTFSFPTLSFKRNPFNVKTKHHEEICRF